ncbi:MAG: hypothetical protein JWN73_2630 [Betaproteobacteria bacterium]|nr:hypothetical protein [Betaproteobacteria bacterium]
MRTRDPNVIQAMYGASRSRIDEWTDADPVRVLAVVRHVAAALNFLQCAALAFLYYVAFSHEPDEAPPLLYFALAPVANVIALWPFGRKRWANVAGAGVNLVWVLGMGGWLLFGGMNGLVLEAFVVGPQALALAVQGFALAVLPRERP